MDTDPDNFQLLPDELVIKILTNVNSLRQATTDKAVSGSARDFVWAQSTCKRFLALTRAVKTLNWQFGSFDKATWLARFLQHPDVNLQELTLVMTSREVKVLPSHVLFTKQLIEGLPERVNFHFVIDDIRGPELDISMLIAHVLISPVLEHLSISSEGGFIPAVNNMHNRPPSQLRSLRFDHVSIQPEALEHLLMRCFNLEFLEVLIGGNANRWPPSTEPEIVSIRSNSLKKLTLRSLVRVAARVKSSTLVTLDNQSERLALATPMLTSASIDVASLSEENPIRWVQPLGLGHLCFKGVVTLDDWRIKVVPLLMQSAELRSLEFANTRMVYGPEAELKTLLADDFVAHLPKSLESLRISSGLLRLLRFGDSVTGSHHRLKALGVSNRLEGLDHAKFRRLGAYFGGIQAV